MKNGTYLNVELETMDLGGDPEMFVIDPVDVQMEHSTPTQDKGFPLVKGSTYSIQRLIAFPEAVYAEVIYNTRSYPPTVVISHSDLETNVTAASKALLQTLLNKTIGKHSMFYFMPDH